MIDKSEMIFGVRAVIEAVQAGKDIDKILVKKDIQSLSLIHIYDHYDHVGGLDHLRPFCRFSEIPVYSYAYTAAHLRARMPYCFVDKKYPGVPRIYCLLYTSSSCAVTSMPPMRECSTMPS